MSGKKTPYRFESEVHLGLLSIILLLVLMSLVSNFVLFKARIRLQENTAGELRSAAMAVTRTIRENNFQFISQEETQRFRKSLQLSSLMLVPSAPPSGTPEDRARWLAGIISRLPGNQVPEAVDRLLTADIKRLTRGKGDQFYMVMPIQLGEQRQLLLLSMESPDLAYLQDAGRVILWVGFGASAFVALVYFILSQFIFKPFRRIKQEAQRAGRRVGETDNEADSVVEEYRRIIAELREKEAELLRLNATVQSRADSLEQFNEYLLSSIDSGIVTLDDAGFIKTVNDAACRILGNESKGLHGQAISTLFDDTSIIRHQIRLVLQGLPKQGFKEVSYQLPDGSTAILGVAVSAVRDTDNRVIGASVLFNDLTEVTRLRQQVEQKNRLEALGEMAAGLAHQIRNSMGAIGGYGNLIKRRLTKSDIPTDTAESLLKEAKEAEDLISKFLAFARPLQLQPEPLSVAGMLREVIAGFQARPDCTHIKFEIQAGEEDLATADALLLKQAISNLVDNSIHSYDGRPGTIRVEVTPRNGTIAVVIRDNGCGIPADKLSKVFTPFYSSRPSGTGLGLPLTSRIIDMHGGQLEVESTVGRGTAVTIYLPVEPSLQPA